MLHLACVLNFGLVAHVALSHSLNRCNDLLVLGVWIWLLEWILLSSFALADLQFENSFI